MITNNLRNTLNLTQRELFHVEHSAVVNHCLMFHVEQSAAPR